MNAVLRQLPPVHEVLDELRRQDASVAERPGVIELIRHDLESLRQRLRQGESLQDQISAAAVARRVAEAKDQALAPTLRFVINATGILLHTNLGRAPLAESAARAAYEAGRGCLNLELDLASGQRSNRADAVREWLCRLLNAESATVVNNNAAATVIALKALAKDREVIVSRGELVEIGGSFRIPEIMAVSGAVLREVGTTNITRINDYAAAICDRTAALLRVHASNYRVVGHTAAPTLDELVQLARAKGLAVIDDVGSGALVDFGRWGLMDEPLPGVSLATGADLVLFSGDKLLGGPQCGILAGRANLIQRIEADPLMRAFRVDKMTLAALEATLRLYLRPPDALLQIPLFCNVTMPLEKLRSRAERLQAATAHWAGFSSQAAETTAFVGGGSLPNQGLPSIAWVVRGDQLSASQFAQRLRVGTPAVVARLEQDQVWFDLRSVSPDHDIVLLTAVQAAYQAS